jgi:hypothetical protein
MRRQSITPPYRLWNLGLPVNSQGGKLRPVWEVNEKLVEVSS